jgi:hypothetical protein
MESTYAALICAALFGLAIGRIGDGGDEVDQGHGDLIEKPERELDHTAFGGLGTEHSDGLSDPGYYGGFGAVGAAEYSGGLNREFGTGDNRVYVVCKDDGCMERVKSLGQVHYEYRYIKAIAVTIPLYTLVRINGEADVE